MENIELKQVPVIFLSRQGDEMLAVSEGFNINNQPCDEVYLKYQVWCQENGLKFLSLPKNLSSSKKFFQKDGWPKRKRGSRVNEEPPVSRRPRPIQAAATTPCGDSSR